MKLLIISHTEHYKTSSKQLVGWSPTVNEINHLAPYFESIIHVAMLHDGESPKGVLSYSEENIEFIALPALGGTSLFQKIKILFSIPKVLKTVRQNLKKADAFQLRTPTGIGVFLIPYLSCFGKKKGWYKYAGNWNQENPPLGYRLQRYMLKKQKRNVTINGQWNNQPKHCITFENPCLSDTDIIEGKAVILSKNLNNTLNFCYVGRLETPKGVGRIIEAFKNLDTPQKNRVGQVHLVGDGEEKSIFIDLASDSGIEFIFHGYLDRNQVFDIYKKCHFFLMPTTASEGFPKVIAEASNFGCIPVVSSVSAIAQYIKHGVNGFIIEPVTSHELTKQLNSIFKADDCIYQNLLKQSQKFVGKFTFTYYTSRILNEILDYD